MNFLKNNLKYLSNLKQFNFHAFSSFTGISKTTLDAWFKGKSEEPSISQLLSISEFFQIPADNLLKQNLSGKVKKQKQIKFLVLDVDGVMTDGGMYYTEQGDDMKKFNTKDGMGIKELIKNGFPVGIISASFVSKLVERRAKALGVQYIYIGTKSKFGILEEWCKQLRISLKEIAFIGDDINDIEIMQKVGLSACPADALEQVKAVAGVILSKKGGDGCIREFIDNYISFPILPYPGSCTE
ncbi:MAG: HAD-IIIA family hydrolase [Bacteroidia bacterium]|nr:HAD-IIIA family hydrolase [Bacteroidia bacterium]